MISALLIFSLNNLNSYGQTINPDFEFLEKQLKIDSINSRPNTIKTTINYINSNQKIKISEIDVKNYCYMGLHPALDISDKGQILSAYYDINFENIIWTYSTDDGKTFEPGIFWEGGGDYPSIKNWDKDIFYGTFVTNKTGEDNGCTYLFDTFDPTDINSYRLMFWDWSSFGWYDMIDADIACDSSENSFEWGVSCYIMSSAYQNGYIAGPTLVYSDENEKGSAWISWCDYNGCRHCDIDIDPITHMVYAIYDWKDQSDNFWKLILRKLDFKEIENGYDETFIISGIGNLTKPKIAVFSNNIIILAESDQNINTDIFCLHTSDGNPNNLIPNVITSSSQDDICPDIAYDKSGNFFMTYVESNNLFAMKSDNFGLDWTSISRSPINKNLFSVCEEYKTTYLSKDKQKVMWTENNNDYEIWISDISDQSNTAPNPPKISSADFLGTITKNYFISTTDPDNDEIFFYVDWGDGLFTDWIGPYKSGQKINISHSWQKKGEFKIRAKSKDIFDKESSWSEFIIKIPRYKQLLKTIIHNILHQFPLLFRYLILSS